MMRFKNTACAMEAKSIMAVPDFPERTRAPLVSGALPTTCGPPQLRVQGGVVTTIVAKSWTEPPLVEVAVAVLGREPAVVVGLVMWTV